MRYLMTGAIVCLATTVLAEEPFASLSFDEACKKAREEKKIVLIDFYTTWCGPCKLLDRTTWKDDEVRKWLGSHAIALKIDAEKNRKLASNYNIRSFPTILFLKPDGKELDRLVGYRGAEEFLEDAEGAISGKDIVARAREKMEAGGKNDPMQRIQYGRALAQKGKHKEALEEYLWCFDHGMEANPAFAGVRLSFLLGNIHQLGADYKPAIKALVESQGGTMANVVKITTFVTTMENLDGMREVRARYLRLFADHGIGPDRLILPADESEVRRRHLARYGEIDIALDHCALGDDRERMPIFRQHLDDAAGDAILLLDRLIGIGVGAERNHLALIARPRQLLAQLFRGVDLGEETRFEVDAR